MASGVRRLVEQSLHRSAWNADLATTACILHTAIVLLTGHHTGLSVLTLTAVGVVLWPTAALFTAMLAPGRIRVSLTPSTRTGQVAHRHRSGPQASQPRMPKRANEQQEHAGLDPHQRGTALPRGPSGGVLPCDTMIYGRSVHQHGSVQQRGSTRMRKTATLAISLLATAALVTGCGSEKKDASPAKAGEASPSASASGEAKGSSSQKKGLAHQVVFHVGGTGKVKVLWIGNTNHFEEVTLPWTKTETVQLVDAELKVGVTVSVVPGSVEGPDGMLKAAPCTINVDGKQVADNQDGKSAKPCEYKLKD
ncbi:hypothetical protein ACF073_37820 [Streptomyces sp. NPDC015171]|uniref:hypothetical protein n=1 Tax=Streptomyces sp. NPDC015171 TaxID=3364945 RepID=UPI00370349D0